MILMKGIAIIIVEFVAITAVWVLFVASSDTVNLVLIPAVSVCNNAT